MTSIPPHLAARSNTPPSPPMRPALLRRRSRHDHAVSKQTGMLRREGEWYVFTVNERDIRLTTLGQGVNAPDPTALPQRFEAVLWPRTNGEARVVWMISSLRPSNDRPKRSATYISGTVKAFGLPGAGQQGHLTVTISPRKGKVPPFDLTLLLTKKFPVPAIGQRVLVHAHQAAGHLVAHHVFDPQRLS